MLLLVAYLVLGLAFAPASPAGILDHGDHTGEDHSFENHKGEDLDNIILTGANLESTNFRDTSFRDAIMISAYLLNAVLINADSRVHKDWKEGFVFRKGLRLYK